MTYTFKLARRLARCKTGLFAVLALALGCSGSESTVGPESGPTTLDPTVIEISPDSAAVEVDGEVQFEATADTAIEASSRHRGWSRWRKSQITLLSVSPDPARVATGGTLSFNASGKNESGYAVQPAVTWIATGGKIDGGGKYVAGKTAGQYLVIARTSNGVADTAKVAVMSSPESPAPTKRVVLSPASVTLTLGQQQQFSVTGKSSDGSSFSVDPSYSATGGAVSSRGVFTAGQTPGAYRVIVTDQGTGLADTSSVDVVAATIGSVSVSPASAGLTIGQSRQFDATVRDQDGNTLSAAAVSWATSNAVSATVNSTGRVTATGAGTATITASAGDKHGAATVTVTSDTPPPPPPPPPPSGGCPASGYSRLVQVSSASQLGSALSGAQPGDQIRLAPGTYGKVTLTRSGTASQPITLCGSGATINGGSTSGGYALYLNGVSYWRIFGISVTGGQKGVVFDRAHRNVLDGVEVHHVGMELVHLRLSSTQDTIRNSHIHHSGQVGNQHYGEGIYIGSSVNNYDNDASNNNVILNNVVEDVGSDGIEAKENVRGTIVRGNTVRRTGNPDGGSPGAIGTRGGNGVFECNDVTVTGSMNGFQVYSGGGAGDGDNNTFRYNKVTLGSGKVIVIHSSQTGNTVIDNTATGRSAACS